MPENLRCFDPLRIETHVYMLRHAHHDAANFRLRPIRIEAQIRQTIQYRIQRTRHFDPRQVLADADVRSEGKGKMPMLRLAEDVESIRLVEPGRVTVRRSCRHVQEGAGRNLHAPELRL